jgi:hypothetical protein
MVRLHTMENDWDYVDSFRFPRRRRHVHYRSSRHPEQKCLGVYGGLSASIQQFGTQFAPMPLFINS